MARQRQVAGPHGQPTPMQAVDMASQEYLASEITRVVESVKAYDQSTVKGQLWQKPASGQGGYGFIEEIYPKSGPEPFDLPEILTDLKQRFGFGQFELRIFAGGRQRVVVQLAVARERGVLAPGAVQQPAAAAPAGGMGGEFGQLVALMMTQQQASADRMAEMMASAQRSQTDLLAAVLPALAGNRGGGAAETVALVTALQANKPDGMSMKEMVETLVALKGLAGGDDGARDDAEGGIRIDPADLVSSGARLVGPAMRAIGDLVQQRRGGDPGGGSAGGTAAPSAAAPLALTAPGSPPVTSRFRLVELVKPHVLYMFGAGHDPEKAADLVYDIVVANEVTEAEIHELAAAFALSPNGLQDLAREGIDLTSNPEWATEFFGALLRFHNEEAHDPGGAAGGAANPAADGAADAEGTS